MISGFGTNSAPIYTTLDSWSFHDNTNWTSDLGYNTVSFSNLAFSTLGDGASLVVDTNLPAWLQFNIVESSGATNFSPSFGSVVFWVAPNDWASASAGGNGLGGWGRLFEAGAYTTNSSIGLWSIYLDEAGNNLYFSTQTNDLSGTLTTYLTAPISWTTHYFHFVALTYSPTNTTLYIDGAQVTNCPGLTVYPGPNVTTFSIGSDSTGVYQSQALFNSVATYSAPLDAGTIQQMFTWEYNYYTINPVNKAMFNLASAPSSQTTFTPINDVITGPGFLVSLGAAATCATSTTNVVWITNVTATVAAGGTMNLSFAIEGGVDGVYYDVFANSVLSFGSNGVPWSWMGQGQHCQAYSLTNLPSTDCFLILGTPQSSTPDGLTDAYKLLVAKGNPNAYSSDGTGMADGWEVLYFGHIGIDPNGDPDGDGLSNYQEFRMSALGYNPTKWNSSTNSAVGDGFLSFNGDGLANVMEASFGGSIMTNSTAWKANTAGDGLPDEYKTMVGLSTNSVAPAPGLPSYNKNPIQ